MWHNSAYYPVILVVTFKSPFSGYTNIDSLTASENSTSQGTDILDVWHKYIQRFCKLMTAEFAQLHSCPEFCSEKKSCARIVILIEIKMVKQFQYWTGHTLKVPGSWCSQISRQSVHEGGKVVRPTHRPPLPLRKYSWYSFLSEAESTPVP